MAGVNKQLTDLFPVYNTGETSTEHLAKLVLGLISEPNQEFANCFVNGIYKQDRNILTQAANNMMRHNVKNT